MLDRLEEEPEPEEEPTASQPVVPSVAPAGQEFQYRTEVVSVKQLTDGKTLAELLNGASADSWELVEIIAAGERHVVLLRKLKRREAEGRRVGFSLQGP